MAAIASQRTGPPPLDVAGAMRQVARRFGKSRLRQLSEIAILCMSGTRISPTDYYRHHLYDDRLSWADKRRFLGDNRVWEIVHRVSSERWFAVADDKLVASTLLRVHGIATPRLKAIVHPYRTSPEGRALATPESVAAFLRDPQSFPLFVKPAYSFESRSTAWIQAHDPATDELVRVGAERVSVAAYVEELWRTMRTAPERFDHFDPSLGFLFQEVVRQHESLVALCGETVASTRTLLYLDDDGPRIVQILWKIPAPSNISDNFWLSGNLLAALDPDSGEVRRVIRGADMETEELETNPYSGKRLLGYRLPFFAELVATLKRGAGIFPKVRYQAWDVAIGPQGPIVLEVNNGSGFLSTELATQKGFWTDEFRGFVRRAEAGNPTRPWGPFVSLHPRVVGHRLGPLYGAYKFVRSLVRGKR